MRNIKYAICGSLAFLLAGTISVNADAMPSAVDNKITLTDNLELTETFTVNKGEEITLDLAGHTITGSADINYYTINIEGGTLNIIDSGDNGKIICNEEEASCIRNNEGTLEIDGIYVTSPFATIKNEPNSTLTINNSEIITTHQGSSSVGFTGSVQNYGNATITNTTITAESDYALFARSNETDNSLTIVDKSTLNGKKTIHTERPKTTDKNNPIITTQTINVSNSNLNGLLAGTSLTGTIYKFSGNITTTTNDNSISSIVLANAEEGTIVNINTDYSKQLIIPKGITVNIPKDYTLTASASGIVITGTLNYEGELKNVKVYNEGTNSYYPTLYNAISAMDLDTTGNKVVLLDDLNETQTLYNKFNRKETTIDLNGHTINATKGLEIANNGKVIIVDNSKSKTGLVNTAITNKGSLTILGGTFNVIPTTADGATTTFENGTYIVDTPAISTDTFTEILEQNGNIEYTYQNDNGETVYTWTFKGTDITEPKEVNTEITFTNEAPETIREDLSKLVTSYKDVTFINFLHEGTLPGKANIKYYVGSEYTAGTTLKISHYNETTKELENEISVTVDENGYITFDITECSSYVLYTSNGETTSQNTTTTTNEEIKTAQTGDINITLIISTIALTAIGIIIASKKLATRK